jgi:UDP-N-acetyl-D-mannosaminuronic acid dehydrogenase
MQLKENRVCIVGLGYIGLPTAALLARNGYMVHGVDISQHAVSTINQGKIHIVEPDLGAFVQSAVASGRLHAATKPDEADVFIICVPTPFIPGGNATPQPDLSYVVAAAKSISSYIRPGNVIILESTSPVGTTELVRDTLANSGVDVSALHFSYCPERVLPGRIMTELVENDRIVGGLTPEAASVAAKFYATFVRGEVLKTDARTAEMCKLVENSFRDVNIAFANELSMLCESLQIDVLELIRLANHHPRVNILQPGCGVGGHCIAVDPWFIVAKDPECARLIRVAREVNDYKEEWVIERIKNAALKFEIDNGKKARIACMGLAFKPDIDDLRESPALKIAISLRDSGFDVLAVEPNIESFEGLNVLPLVEGVRMADIVVFLVKHRQFLDIDLTAKAVLDFGAVTTSIHRFN